MKYIAYYNNNWCGEGDTEEACMTSAIAFLYEEGYCLPCIIRNNKIKIERESDNHSPSN